MDQVAWLEGFLAKRSLNKPDGRALYAYKCTEQEYGTARSLTAQMLSGVIANRDYRRFAEVFCLFAAEAWQREYAGGVWSYGTIFSALRAPVPVQNLVRDWIVIGLNWWKRPIIVSERGDNQYLLTIGCEGGLPVRLLRNADTRLSSYFRELLTGLNREPGIPAEVLARREMSLLPLSLRRDVVFGVSAQLVRVIAQLQPLTSGAENPIQALDRVQPEWRAQLPLPLGNQAVEVLLGKLVRHAQTLKEGGRAPVGWRRGLDERSGERFLYSVLDLPDHLDSALIEKWTGRNPAPPRLRLQLSASDQAHTVAVLSRLKGRSGDDVYRCEVINRQGVRLIGRPAMWPTRLTLTDGAHSWDLDVPGDQGLGQLPWVFHDSPEGEACRLLSEGSARSKQPSLLVAVNAGDCVVTRSPEAKVERIGELARVGRDLYRVSDRTAAIDTLGGACGFYCASDRDSTGTYRISGSRLPWVLGDRSVYMGAPAVQVLGTDGSAWHTISQGIQWGPVGAREIKWRSDIHACLGRIWLRCVDLENGDVLMRRRIDVVPAGCRLSLRIGTPVQPGKIEFKGLEGAGVRSLDLTATLVEHFGSDVEITLSDPASPVDAIGVELSWPSLTPIELQLPTPRHGGAFIYNGCPLPRDALVALDRLGGTRVVAQSPTMGNRFLVDAVVRGGSAVDPELHRLLWLQLSLAESGGGRYELSLHRIQDQLGTTMAMVSDVLARAELVLLDTLQHQLARIEVARYDLVLNPLREQSSVTIPEMDLERLGDDWEDRVSVEMIRLWDLERSPLTLNRLDSAECIAWAVPPDLEPGPWWVVGRDGGWARFRPLLWTVLSIDSPSEGEASADEGGYSPLISAIREPKPLRREFLLEQVVHELAEDVTSPDWERLFSYLRLTREHPAHSLEILAALVGCRETLAIMLFKASLVGDDFDLAWSLADEMPFAWYLVPASCWEAAAKSHFGGLREVLSEIDGGDTILAQSFAGFRSHTAGRLPCFSILCDWLQEALFPGIPLQDQTLIRIRTHPEFMATVTSGQVTGLQGELQGRVDPDARWPEAPRVMEQAKHLPPSSRYDAMGFRRSVLCAPFVAASIVMQDWNCSTAMTLELRRLRAFDQAWFDSVFSMQISAGLAMRRAVEGSGEMA